MELFQKNKNIYFECIVDIINDMMLNEHTYTRKELNEYFNIRNLSDENRDSLYDDCDTSMLTEVEGQKEVSRTSRQFKPRVELPIPILLTSCELEYLREALKDELFRQLLSEDTIVSLEDYFANHQGAFNIEEVTLYKNRKMNSYGDLRHNLRLIIRAIVENKKIKYNNIVKGELYHNRVSSPYRLLYSTRLNRLQLIVKPEKQDRMVLINIESIQEMEVLEEDCDYGMEELLKERRKTLVLEIENTKNSVERCFSLFSHLQKTAEYKESEDIHLLKVIYYDFDEKDIIKDILSMGSSVIVLEPADIREQIIQTIMEICDRE